MLAIDKINCVGVRKGLKPLVGANMEKKGIVILGMHRSGTSATTGLFDRLGVTLGKKLYAGHSNINAKGYFEHSAIADANDEALLSIGSSWDDILLKDDGWWKAKELVPYEKKIKRSLRKDFGKAAVWAVKDPRICRLLPWWLEIIASEGIQVSYLIVLRPPHEVYLSLKRRDGFSEEKSYLLWLLHYLDAEFWTRGLPRAFVVFDDLINNPLLTLKAVEKNLGLSFPVPVEMAVDELSAFISKDLVHHGAGQPETVQQHQLAQLATALYKELAGVAARPELTVNSVAVDDIAADTHAIQRLFLPMLVEHLRGVNKIRSDSQITLSKVLRSSSWVLGKPVRFVERLLGGDV